MAGPVPLPNLNVNAVSPIGDTDTRVLAGKTFSFAGATINKGAPSWFYIAALAVAGFGGLYLLKGR